MKKKVKTERWLKLVIVHGKTGLSVESHKLSKTEARKIRVDAITLASYLKGAYQICVCGEVT